MCLLAAAAPRAEAAGGAPAAPSGSTTPQELDALLAGLSSEDAAARWAAARAVVELGSDAVPVLGAALQKEYKASDESLKRVVYGLRKDLKDARIKQASAKGKTLADDEIERETPPDFLKLLVERRQKDNLLAWQPAAQVMTILVALGSIGTTEALSLVLGFAPAHEGAFRKEVYQVMLWAGEKALPAVVRMRTSKDEDIRTVVTGWLGKMEMERPGQQVQVKDPLVLAEVLSIYGKLKLFDTIDAICPFISSDNPIVRDAARQAILAFGKSALWALRKEYRNETGKEPDPSWSAEQVAAEIFKVQDSERLAPLNAKMEKGLAHAAKKEFDGMEEAFRAILAAQPLYERKGEMVPGYLAMARQAIGKKNFAKASRAVRVARRVNGDPARAGSIMALQLYVDGMMELAEGVADPEIMRQALALDPGLEEARAALDDIEQIYRGRKIRGYRVAAAGGIACTALLLLLLIVFKRWI